MVVIDSIIDGATNFSIRGQIESLKTGHELLFIGSPWFDSIENVNNAGLNLHDFAHHDTLTDMLHLLKTQEITNQDLKHLLETINKQKNELGSLDYLYHHLITKVFNDKHFFDFGISNEQNGTKLNSGLLFWKESFGAQTVTQHFYEVETQNDYLLENILI